MMDAQNLKEELNKILELSSTKVSFQKIIEKSL